MFIRETLKKYPKIETELLLAYVLKKPKEFLFLNPDHRLTQIQVDRLAQMIHRREKGEPIAYILGYKDFCGLRFKVNKNVLVPRPETESLVESVKLKVESWKQEKRSGVILSATEGSLVEKKRDSSPRMHSVQNDASVVRILDLGTGSGCIAVALATEFQISNYKFQMTASDISDEALKVAKQNAKIHRTKIKFIKSNLLQNIKFTPDILIANLPYGWTGVKNRFSFVKDGLKFEPQLALFTKEKGLYLYRQLLEQIARRKEKPKLIYLEFDPRQKRNIKILICKQFPKSHIQFYKDFRNLWRFVEVTL